MPRAVAAVACAALLASLVACASDLEPGGTLEHARVEFTFDEVTPATVHITGDGNITWINLAPESVAFVVFPQTIVSGFVCGDQLFPYFRRSEAGYTSRPITAEEGENVELPCPLRTGSYPYEIWVTGAGLGGLGGTFPGQKMKATIVVE